MTSGRVCPSRMRGAALEKSEQRFSPTIDSVTRHGITTSLKSDSRTDDPSPTYVDRPEGHVGA